MEQAVELNDNNFPPLLKTLKGLTPKKLYFKGSWDTDIFENCLAVVGSRHLTSYGRRATEQLVTEIAAAGVTIVSGFMYGGDEAAHSAAVKAGGRTIAVMPCGIDLIHPSNQGKLYQEILDSNGLVMSEYEGEFFPKYWSYVQRNRIVAGLSKAILVTEAGLESGTLLTAGYAKQFGRKIFVLPGQITSEVSKGAIKLLKEGATPIMEAKDILDFLGISPKKTIKKAEVASGDNIEQQIIDQLKREPLEADAIARMLGMSAAKVGTTLSLMQLKGFINQEEEKYYLN